MVTVPRSSRKDDAVCLQTRRKTAPSILIGKVGGAKLYSAECFKSLKSTFTWALGHEVFVSSEIVYQREYVFAPKFSESHPAKFPRKSPLIAGAAQDLLSLEQLSSFDAFAVSNTNVVAPLVTADVVKAKLF